MRRGFRAPFAEKPQLSILLSPLNYTRTVAHLVCGLRRPEETLQNRANGDRERLLARDADPLELDLLLVVAVLAAMRALGEFRVWPNVIDTAFEAHVVVDGVDATDVLYDVLDLLERQEGDIPRVSLKRCSNCVVVVIGGAVKSQVDVQGQANKRREL